MSPTLPNILLIVTDDQRRPGTMEVMPKTVGWFQTGDVPGRAPVTGGTDYPNAVCTTPLCAPSRTSILTGQYAHNHGVWNNDPGVEADPTDMLQQRLRTSPAGYRTGIFGKYLNRWTQRHPAPEGPPGFDRWSIFEGGQYFPVTVNEQGVQKTVLQYSTDYFADRAVEFLDEAARDGKPWFLYVAPATPHSPFTPDPKYASAPVPRFRAPPSYFEDDRRDKPMWARWTFADPRYVESTRVGQLRMLRSADDLVDKLMATIAELGEDASTLAFFTSDHGMHWGEHGLDTKASSYLESIQVPFYVRWPGRVEANRSNQALVASIDVAPTALDAADLSAADRPMDGRSLLEASAPRNRILTEYDLYRGPTAPAAIRQHRKWASLLTPTFHYIETYKPGTDERVWHEYYDLTEDSYELTNLLHGRDVDDFPPIAELSARLAADRTCAGPSCPRGGDDSAPISVDLDPLRVPAAPQGDTGGAALPPGQTRIHGPAVRRLPGTSVVFTLVRADEPPTTVTHIRAFECSLDREPFRRCGRHVTIEGLSNGPHELRAVSIDEAGNRDPVPASFEWTTEAVPSWRDEPDPGWPDITEAAAGEPLEARVVVPDGRGGWFVGGSFAGVGGRARANLVHLKADKTVDEAWTPCTNGPVKTMALSADRSTLYVGGAFTSVDGEPRGRIAALDAATGDLTPWAPGLDDEVTALAVGPDSVYVVGAFATVGGEPRLKVAEVAVADGTPIAWDPRANPGATLLALRVSPDTVYVGGSGLTEVGGAPRRNLAALDRASGRATAWNPSPDGDVEALEMGPDGASILVGGSFREIGAPSTVQPHAAEVRLDGEGEVTGWRPVPDYEPAAGGTPTVLDFSITDLTPPGRERRWSIVIAGAYNMVKARYPRNQISEVARFDDLIADGYPADWDPKLDTNAALALPPAASSVFSVAQSGSVIAIAGNFYASGFTARGALSFYRKRQRKTAP